MINLLWLLLILGVQLGALWVAHKFFGKTGLIAFGIFSLVNANLMLPSISIAIGTIEVVAGAVLYLPVLLALVITVEKYGTGAGFTYGIVTAILFLAFGVVDTLFTLAVGAEITFLSIFTGFLASLLVFVIECLLAVVMNELFKGSKIHNVLKLSIILAVLTIIHVCLMGGVLAIDVAIGQNLLAFLAGILWQSAVVLVLLVPMIWVILATKPKDLENFITSKVFDTNDFRLIEEKTQTEASATEEKPEVEVVLTAEETPAEEPVAEKVAKKPATKKSVAKKPATKKTTAKKSEVKEEKPAEKPAVKKTATKTTAKKSTKTEKTETKKTVAKTTTKKSSTAKTTKKPAEKATAKTTKTVAKKPATKKATTAKKTSK